MLEPDDETKVGYGKPPKETRFVKGRSGNPAGRPKGAKGLRTIVREALSANVTVKRDGGVESVSAIEGLILKLLKKAMDGEPRAMERIVALAERYGEEDAGEAAEETLSLDDAAILRRFKERMREEAYAEIRAEERSQGSNTADPVAGSVECEVVPSE